MVLGMVDGIVLLLPCFTNINPSVSSFSAFLAAFRLSSLIRSVEAGSQVSRYSREAALLATSMGRAPERVL